MWSSTKSMLIRAEKSCSHFQPARESERYQLEQDLLVAPLFTSEGYEQLVG